MAHLSQRLILAAAMLALPAIAAEPEFSHRLHLGAKLTCTICHAPAVKSTRAADNNLPSPALCKGCHGDSREVRKPRAVTVTKFNHQLHLKLGNVAPLIAKAIEAKTYLGPAADVRAHLDTKTACAACHRGLERMDKTSLASFPHMADCLVCHNQIDPPFSCEKCHDQDPQQLKPATHTADWLERHSRKGAISNRESCAVCHGRRFTCLGCH